MKILKSIEAIEQERGQFKIKCLVAKDPVDIRWDLILSADWFDKYLMKRLTYLTHKILAIWTMIVMAQFLSIMTFDATVDNELMCGLLKIQGNYALGRYNPYFRSFFCRSSLNRQVVNATLEAVA